MAEVSETFDIELPGGIVLEGFPGDTPREKVKAAVLKAMASPDFDDVIDKKRGAPAEVRAAVGGGPDQDRLANIRRYYADAVPYGDDNFVFTDPETQRPTLYNPKGLDFGDVASVGRETSQVAFSGLGAAAGAIATAPSGPGAVGGGVAGAGIGNVVGGSLWDAFGQLAFGRVDTRTLPQRAVETGIEFGSAAVGQRVGELAPEAFKSVMGAAKPQAQRLIAAYGRLRVPPTAPGAITGSKVLGSIEKGLEAAPASAGVMQKNAEAVLSAVSNASDDIARKFGTVRTGFEAGQAIKGAATRAAERFGFAKAQAYEKAFDMIGADTRITVPAVQRLHSELTGELARAPRSMGFLKQPIRMLANVIEDAGDDGIRFDAIRSVRTSIGQMIDSPDLVGGSTLRKATLKRIYGALSEDIAGGAASVSDDAARALAGADRYTRLFTNTAGETLNKLQSIDADERAFEFVLAQGKHGARNLARMRRVFEPQEWDDIAASTLHRLGRATPGAQDATGQAFSVNSFLTNWNRLTPEAKQILFGGERYKDLAQGLDDLVEVTSSLKGMERLANTSNTGRTMISFFSVTALLDVLSTGGAATGSLASVTVPPWATARLMTSPSFVRWLTTPVTKASAIAPHLGRLAAIAEAEPELKEAVYQYLAAMRAAPEPGDAID